jgi:arylsulfatase A-like enzyme
MAANTNFVLILADDMGFSDLGCYGGEARTPNVDALAAGGLRYSQVYNAARCCPSRAALLTGVHPHQAGIGWMTFGGLEGSSPPGAWTSMLEQRGSYQGFLDDSCATIADVLRTEGYRTLLSGKWHLGGDVKPEELDLFHPSIPGPPVTPLERGFDKFWGLFGGAASYFNPRILMDGNQVLDVEADDFYLTDAITDHAIEMIESTPAGQPFFLYLSYTAPHWPLHALEEEVTRYERTFRVGWDQIRAERHERLRDAGLLDPSWQISARDPDSYPFADARYPEWEAMRMAVYAAQIDRMDQGIGRVVDYLRVRDLLNDTVVLVCSDNGGSAEFLQEEAAGEGPSRYEGSTANGREIRVGNVPDLRPGGPGTFMSYDLPWANASNSPFRRFKSWVHEGGISTPLVVHWPSGISEPGIRHVPIHFIDVLPTIAELAGATIPTERAGIALKPVEGESFALSFAQRDWRRAEPLWFEHEGNRALREESWKLVSRHPGEWELYNMEQDRTETSDLAHRETARVKRMVESWELTAARVGVRPDLSRVWDGVAGWHIRSAEERAALFARWSEGPRPFGASR